MSTEATSKRPLTQLNYEIEQLESDSARLEAERAGIATEVRGAARRLTYLQLARWIRKPAATFAMWPFALPLIGGGLVGFLFVILVSIVTGSLPWALLSFLIGLGTGASLLGTLLYRPSDTILPAAIHDCQSQSRLTTARLREKSERIAEITTRLQKLIDERRDQIASGKLQRAALLQRNWKNMQGAEWEDFVVEVLRTHGAAVERGGGTRTGSTLVADFSPKRVAVLTLGEGHVANSATVQEALAAKDRLQCDSCAIVINRRFTGAAQDFAQRNGCTAIGASEFPDFVLGKIEL
jgi:HJR/Mrr/RecB family endonuclease